jgi:SAM-dependent methyltransferase
MTHQGRVWEKEYHDQKFLTKENSPQSDTLNFLKFLKKERKLKLENLNILDLGCGTGRNSNYLAELGNNVVGIDIARNAIEIARFEASHRQLGNNAKYIIGDIGESYEVKNNWADIILDVTSSNSLNEKGREVYLSEMNRILKKSAPRHAGSSSTGEYIFVRALAKDGNKNVKNLIKNSPGPEYDTYIIKDIGLTERVFSRDDFIKTYSKYFKILELKKKTNYTRFNNRIYKRDYWLAYLGRE